MASVYWEKMDEPKAQGRKATIDLFEHCYYLSHNEARARNIAEVVGM